MASSCAALLAASQGAWHEATHAPFLADCKSGAIQAAQFNAWLVQDATFAREFTRFLAALLCKAPAAQMDLLLGGLGAMKDELLWFAELAAQRGLPQDAAALATHPTCRRYLHFMHNVSKQPYAVHAVAFWAIERSYNEGWRNYIDGMVEPFRGFGLRWGSDAFCQYVVQLESMADDALAAASEAERVAAATAFQQVCELERDFWAMAYAAE